MTLITNRPAQDRYAAGAIAPTLGQFLYDCLKKEGITDVFGIPGDYNFSLLDTLERESGIRFVGGRNELGAGYAADAYGRLRGMSALITTFGVGELSACNAVAGASAESVPLIHIVGTPKSADQKAHKRMHHSLLDGDYGRFRRMYGQLCAYTADLTPENAELEIPAAIRIAKRMRKPVYLSAATDLVDKPIVRHAQPAEQPAMTNPNALQAALAAIRGLLGGADSAVLLADLMTLRFGWRQAARRLAEGWNVPAASLLLGKSGFDESHPNYIGLYGGAFGSEQVRSAVESAGCIVAAGLVWTDLNTANYTSKLDRLRLIDIQPESVRVGEALFESVMADDLLSALSGIGWRSAAVPPSVTFPYDAPFGEPDQPVCAASYYPRFQRMLRERDIVVVETGTFSYGMAQLRLPAGADYIGQQGWQSIGYATGAAFGACMAAPDRRVLLFVGDGSLQLTVQEISSMLANGCRPIVFILNNDGYTIEKYLNVKTSGQAYNQIPSWRYTLLAEAFGGQAFTAQARTNRELDEAISAAEREQAHRLSIIEMIVADPLDAPEYVHKLRSHLTEQERLMNG
ncbi:alpha-keto acid decarboxylase family protein [Cohnella zeiphila]|uniref:Alpha-keto-acid decarboxylase n=1 Tax=Cohnella zeiphila TaxID=2761120 RepID=A0A7X0SSG0_9BACL|nr:thiamine pyrophosphate-binding protein [Cohnella zeiphila]MBB6735259.1 alpha-keto acid decarboxylase family protein [Cohnella zeiphila]